MLLFIDALLKIFNNFRCKRILAVTIIKFQNKTKPIFKRKVKATYYLSNNYVYFLRIKYVKSICP